MKTRLFYFLISISLVACSKKQIIDNGGLDGEGVCYSFDIRQCQTDLYSDLITSVNTVAEKENAMKQWLESQDVKVANVKLIENFHEAVCEACDVCPEGGRFFVSFLDEVPEDEALRLLNFSQEENASCP